jgi:hypothetical protein
MASIKTLFKVDVKIVNVVFTSFYLFVIGWLPSYAQTKFASPTSIDVELLNEFILLEINALRKKADANPLEIRTELKPAADDHVNYLVKKKRLSHYQRFNKFKKKPEEQSRFLWRSICYCGRKCAAKFT